MYGVLELARTWGAQKSRALGATLGRDIKASLVNTPFRDKQKVFWALSKMRFALKVSGLRFTAGDSHLYFSRHFRIALDYVWGYLISAQIYKHTHAN